MEVKFIFLGGGFCWGLLGFGVGVCWGGVFLGWCFYVGGVLDVGDLKRLSYWEGAIIHKGQHKIYIFMISR